jgi:endoglucanase
MRRILKRRPSPSMVVAFTALLVALSAVAATALVAMALTGPPPSSTWYVDPQSPANRELASLQAQGRHEEAALVGRIASQPRFEWFGLFVGSDRLKEYVDRAVAVGKVPLVVIFNVEARECRDLAAARRFYDEAAAAIGRRPAVVALEPDSLGSMKLSERACFAAIGYGVRVLSALPGTTVYVEAGASDWGRGALPTMARKLRRVDVCRAGGVLLNATHADWTVRNVRYGRALEQRLPCRLRILLNTAENGHGPNPRTRPRAWCDSDHHYGLGPAPASPTPYQGVAYGWVNRPGYVQQCYDPPVRWALYRALRLAARASTREGP